MTTKPADELADLVDGIYDSLVQDTELSIPPSEKGDPGYGFTRVVLEHVESYVASLVTKGESIGQTLIGYFPFLLERSPRTLPDDLPGDMVPQAFVDMLILSLSIEVASALRTRAMGNRRVIHKIVKVVNDDYLTADCGCVFRPTEGEWEPCPLHARTGRLYEAAKAAGGLRHALQHGTLESPHNRHHKDNLIKALQACEGVAHEIRSVSPDKVSALVRAVADRERKG